MAKLNKSEDYKGYAIEIIRGKDEALAIALKDGFQLTARRDTPKAALEAIKVRIDEQEEDMREAQKQAIRATYGVTMRGRK